MADPVTAGLAGASLISTIGGGLIGAEAAKQQYGAESSMYNYQAGVALQNQQLMRQNAGYALMQGEESAAQSGMATRAQIGQIRAAQGASGLDVDRGTAPAVVRSQRRIGDIEQQTIRSNAGLAAYGQDISAYQYGTQATLDKMAAANAKAAAPLAETASILGSAASVSNKWLGFNSAGNFAGLTPTLNSWGTGISSAISGALNPTFG